MGAFEDAFVEIKTKEEAVNYVTEIIRQLNDSRITCDLATTVESKQMAFQRYNIKYGQALGSLTVLSHVRKLDSTAYRSLREDIIATRLATVVDNNV